MTPVARHLIVELGGCDPRKIDDAGVVLSVIRAAARAAGTKLLHEIVHRFEPTGVTGVGVLAESHIAVHTWPERGYAAVDLMTCRADTDTDGVVASLKDGLGAATVKSRVVDRLPP